MKQAKIEIRSKDIKGLPYFLTSEKSINSHSLLDENADFGDPNLESFWYRPEGRIQHLFIIYTNSQGQEVILRGGPESKKSETTLPETLLNDIKVIYSRYKQGVHDWVDPKEQKLPSIVIARGTDEQMQALIDKMWRRGQEINAGKFDYKLPTPGCSEALCHVQNSNTVVRALVEAAGLPFELPKINGVPVEAPGINGEFKHTFVDKKIKDYLDQPTSNTFSSQTEDTNPSSSLWSRVHSFFWGDTQPAASSIPSSPPPKPWEKAWRFESRGPYDLNVPAWDINWIPDPLWLYTQQSYSGAADPLKGFSLTRDMKREVQACLGDPACTQTTEGLIRRVLQSRPELKDPTHLREGLQRAAQEAAAGFSDPYAEMLSNLFRESKLGQWAHPLREELKYAASHVSPLVLDLDGDGIQLLPYTKGVYFDIDNDGFAERVGWVMPGEGQLARDLNANGRIDDITELFGDDLISAFLKLSLLDSNHDKQIDANDEAFATLLIWQDRNTNGYSEPHELQSLEARGIRRLSLDIRTDYRVIEGNTITAVSSYTDQDGVVRELADVHYHNDDMDTWYVGKKKTPVLDAAQTAPLIVRFRKAALQALLAQLYRGKGIDVRGQWAIKVLKEQVDLAIQSDREDSEARFQHEHQRLNRVYAYQGPAHDWACEQEERRQQLNITVAYAVQKDHLMATLAAELAQQLNQTRTTINVEETQAYHAALEALLADLNARLAQDMDTLTTQHIQANNQAQAALLERMNAQLKQTSDTLYQTAVREQWSQATYDSAVQNNKAQVDTAYRTESSALQTQYNQAIEQSKATLQQQYQQTYETEREVLLARYGQQITDRIETLSEALQQAYQAQHDQKRAQLEQDTVTQLDQVTHAHRHACRTEGKHLLQLLSNQLGDYQHIGHQQVDRLHAVLKKAADQLYFFLGEKLAQSANTTLFSGPKARQRLQDRWQADLDRIELATQVIESEDRIHIDPETLLMPWVRGYGKLPALHIAMTHNPGLKQRVLHFMAMRPNADLSVPIRDILYDWAGVLDIPESARAAAGGNNIEARKVALIEQLTGQAFRQLGAAQFVGQYASASVQKAWDQAHGHLAHPLLIQGPFSVFFPEATYSFLEDRIVLHDTLEGILSRVTAWGSTHALNYDFWVQLGLLLLPHREALQTDLSHLRDRLSTLAGEVIPLGEGELVGDEQDNILRGTAGSDTLKGLGGHDILYGEGSSDELDGGEGDDTLIGRDGIDRLYGGQGDDSLDGGNERDFLYGGEGNDHLVGGDGDDHLEGGAGADLIEGGPGNNTLSYGSAPEGVYVNLQTGVSASITGEQTGHAVGDRFTQCQNLGGSEHADHLIGDEVDNHLNGEGGDDRLEGGKGNDHLFGAKGHDTLLGGDGDDELEGFEGPDDMEGGEGEDTASYHHPYSTEGVTVDLTEGRGFGGYAYQDTYQGIEHVRGSKHDDVLRGNDQANVLQGMEGDDHLEGAGGSDTLWGGLGQDHLMGGEGEDYLLLLGDGDHVEGGAGQDTVSYEYANRPVHLDLRTGKGTTGGLHEDQVQDVENAAGTRYGDALTGDDQDNRLWGLQGQDTLRGGDGQDVLSGGPDADLLDGGAGKDYVDYTTSPAAVQVHLDPDKGEGGVGEQTSQGGASEGVGEGVGKGGDAEGDRYIGIENVIGSSHDDLLVGDVEDNHLYGGKGNDELKGDLGDDILVGGPGADTMDGGIGIDYVSYFSAKEGVEVDLTHGEGHEGEAEGDRYLSIEGVIGSAHNDTLIGKETQDFLEGGKGDDTIYGRAGDDIVSGGSGKNRLYGDEGDDLFYLEDGHNEVEGGRGQNTISYGRYRQATYQTLGMFYQLYLGQRLLPLHPGDNLSLDFDPRGVIVDLGVGDASKQEGLEDKLDDISHIEGSDFHDQLWGNDGDNHIRGFDGDDYIHGGAGHDLIVGGGGFNLLYGGAGNDQFVGSVGVDLIDGGEGQDAITYQYSETGVRVNLKTGRCDEGDAAGDYLTHIENLETTEYDDAIVDTPQRNVISTRDGQDIIHLSGGQDLVYAGAGQDRITVSGRGNPFLIGGTGVDSFIFDASFKTQGPLGVMIADFEYQGMERIDLSQFEAIRSLDDLVIQTVTVRNTDLEAYAPLAAYWGEQQTLTCAMIVIAEDQKIALYDVPADELTSDHFVFS